jgi:hypothetical protein
VASEEDGLCDGCRPGCPYKVTLYRAPLLQTGFPLDLAARAYNPREHISLMRQ